MTAIIIGVAANTYATAETIKHGTSGSSATGSMADADISSSGGGGMSCGQIMSEISRYENKLQKEKSSTNEKIAAASGKSASIMDMQVINSSKSLIRTYQKRIDQLKRNARKKGCM